MVSFSLSNAIAATLSLAIATNAFWLPGHALEKRSTNVTIPALDGTGCPKGSSNITIIPNMAIRPTNVTVEVTTDSFAASVNTVNPETGMIERQRNCIFLVQVLHTPPDKEGDYQYTVTGIQIAGEVDFPDNSMSGSWSGMHYFATGNSNVQAKPFSSVFVGPVKKKFVALTKAPAPVVYSTCGRTEPLAVVNTIAVNADVNDTQNGFISSPSGLLRISLSLEWKKCTK